MTSTIYRTCLSSIDELAKTTITITKTKTTMFRMEIMELVGTRISSNLAASIITITIMRQQL